MRLKLCYVLPKYDLDTEEHFYHNYQFLEELAKEVRVFLIIERCVGKPMFKNVQNVYYQKFVRFLPLRIIELAFLITYVRIRGVKKFYIHYSYFGGLIGAFLCFLMGGKVYYWHCVSVIYRTPWTFHLNDLFHKMKAEIPLKMTLKMIDYLVTGTKSTGDFYHKTFGISKKKTIIIPNEIDLNRFNPEKYDRKRNKELFGIKEDENLVLFVHRIAQRKGAHHLPEIIKRVCNEVSGARFVIAGDGPYFQTLTKRVAELGLNSCVNVLGWVPNREIMGLYSAADLFIMPSEEEGFPRVLLEAMAMGIPFVSADVGGVKDICTDFQKKFCVSIGDNTTFSQKVVEILKNDSWKLKLKKEGLENVRHYSLREIKDKFVQEILIGRKD